jgi:protoheme IX farnesyltransferase
VTQVLDVREVDETASWSERVRLFFDVTRPRVMALVVFTGLPALWLGRDVWPEPETVFWVLLGTALAGGSSSAINAYIERDRDAVMARTRRRPLPAAQLLPRTVLAYGVLLAVVSTLLLGAVGGPGAAAVALATIVFYVFGYTIWLKPRTPQNIVIGGAAGATAPLIASAAVHGTPSVGAWILFLIIFLWTPPHFWAIAIVRRHEYAAAGFPMMPAVVGEQATRWRSLAYTGALVATSLAPWWLGYLGVTYAVAAMICGFVFAGLVVRSLVRQDAAADWAVFKGSVQYLAFLFLFMLVDLLW